MRFNIVFIDFLIKLIIINQYAGQVFGLADCLVCRNSKITGNYITITGLKVTLSQYLFTPTNRT